MRVADIPETLRVRNLLEKEPLNLAGLFNLEPGAEAEVQFHRLHENARQQLYAAVCASARGKVLEVLDEGFQPAEPDTVGIATVETPAEKPAPPAEASQPAEASAPPPPPAAPQTSAPPPPPAPAATTPPPAPPAPPADEPASSDQAGSALDI